MISKKIIGVVLGVSLSAGLIGTAFIGENKNKVEQAQASTLTNGGYDADDYHYYDGTYYDSIGNSAISTGGTTLLSAVCSKIQPGSSFGYDSLWTIYLTSDVYPSDYDGTDPLTGTVYPTTKSASTYRGKIWDMYGDTAYAPGGSAQGAQYKKVGDAYNREHTVPQSWFSESSIPRCDPHHVLATDGYVNNQRGNHPYGEVNGTPSKYTNAFGGIGSPVSTYGSCGDSTVFEPEDEFKGDFARCVLYMAAAYYNFSASFASSNSCFTRSGNYNLLSSYYINLLTKWNAEDPVSQKEIDRNNVIFASSQANRNPFIDHPTWAYKIWGGTPYTWNGGTPSTDPRVISVTVSPATLKLDLNGTKTGTLTANVSVANDAPTTVNWSISPSGKGVTVSNGTVTAANNAETGTYTVTAISTYDTSKKGTCTVTVKDSSQGGSGEQYVITPENCGWSTTAGAQSGTPFTGITISCTNGILTTGTRFTTYKNATFTITSTIGDIAQLDFTFVNTNNGGFASTVTPNAATWSQTTTSGTGGTQAQMTQLVVTMEGSGSTEPTLSSISVSTAPTKTTYTAGEYFSPTGLVINRVYSDTSYNDTYSYAGHTSEFSFTPSTSTALKTSDTSITIGYGGKTTTQSITVNPAPATSISATVSKTYYVGEKISSSDIIVKDNNNTTITSFSFANNNYQFTYNDASSGGTLTNKTFTNAITYNTLKCSLTVQVQRKARVAPSSAKDTITATDLAATGTSYTEFSGVAKGSGAVYAGNSAKNGNNIQLKSKDNICGIVSTTSGGSIQSVKITVANGSNTIDVYGKNTAYTAATDLYNSSKQGTKVGSVSSTNTVTFSTNYAYVGIRANNGAVYISSIEINYGSSDSATNLANYIMYEDTNGQCNTKFSVAKGYFEGLTSTERNTFMTSSDYVVSTARDRLQKWAAALGKTISQSGGDYVISSRNTLIGFNEFNNENAIIAILVVAISGFTLVGGYFFIKKRKEK